MLTVLTILSIACVLRLFFALVLISYVYVLIVERPRIRRKEREQEEASIREKAEEDAAAAGDDRWSEVQEHAKSRIKIQLNRN